MSDGEERRHGFDDISRAIGSIEGKLVAIEKGQDAQWQKLDSIEKTLTDHRIKAAGIAGVVSAVVTGAYHLLKAFFAAKGGGH